MRKFIAGVIIGAIVSSTLFTFAGGILKTIQVAENSVKVLVNGKDITAENYVISGRTFLQIRSISDALNMDIGWDGTTSTVTLNSKSATNAMLPTKDITDAVTANDPKTQFVQHFEKFLSDNHYDEEPDKLGSGQWVKLKYISDGKYSYDIQKTDSLVSPYKATATYNIYRFQTEPRDTKEESALDTKYNPEMVLGVIERRNTYAYQDGKWVFKSCEWMDDEGTWSESSSVKEEHQCFIGADF